MALVENSYTLGEEIANSITHGIGWALSVAGLAILLVFAAQNGNAWHVVSSAIYGTTLILMYAASTMYHSLTHPLAKRVFKTLDHCAIYLLIAGTYTPFTLVTINGPWGWTLFGIIWSGALAGIIFKSISTNRFRHSATFLYLIMGWAALIAIKPMISQLPVGGLVWLLAGGFAYSIGVGFYLWKRQLFTHTIWHLFVLGGSVCHFFAVLFYVIP